MENYRVLMEVLKWLGVEELLTSTAQVSAKWREVSDSRELWLDLFPMCVDLGDLCPKRYYATHFTKSVFVVTSSVLKQYYVVSKLWVEKTLSRLIETNWKTSMTLALPHTLFICGTTSRLENTYTINTHTGTVRVLSTLNPHRQGIGLISVDGVVYAFGGTNTLQTNRLDLKGTMWGTISGATVKRELFNPCLHRKTVYLLGGTGQEAPGEKFDLLTESFSLMSLKLDIETCFALIHKGLLILISDNIYIKRKLTSHKPVTTHKLPNPHLWPNCSNGFDPVIVDNKAFILYRAKGLIVEMDLTLFVWEAYPYQGEVKPRLKGRA